MSPRRSAGRARLAQLAAVVVVALLARGCGIDFSQTSPPSGGRPTPQVSFSLPIESTRSALSAALLKVGLALVDAPEGYRPAESPALAQAQRGTFKVVLPADPGALFVVIYQFADAATAAGAGQEAARYLASGPGQVQFPPDARFALAQYGETLLFAAWSPERTSDDETARAAFDTIAGFGLPIPVTR